MKSVREELKSPQGDENYRELVETAYDGLKERSLHRFSGSTARIIDGFTDLEKSYALELENGRGIEFLWRPEQDAFSIAVENKTADEGEAFRTEIRGKTTSKTAEDGTLLVDIDPEQSRIEAKDSEALTSELEALFGKWKDNEGKTWIITGRQGDQFGAVNIARARGLSDDDLEVFNDGHFWAGTLTAERNHDNVRDMSGGIPSEIKIQLAETHRPKVELDLSVVDEENERTLKGVRRELQVTYNPNDFSIHSIGNPYDRPLELYYVGDNESEDDDKIDIVDVLVMEDQKARNQLGEPIYTYPFGDNPEARSKNHDRRHLFVIGRNFPDKLSSSNLSSDRAEISYGIGTTGKDAEQFATARQRMGDGWKLYQEKTGNAQRDLSAIILNARLMSGVAPGPVSFTLDDAVGNWMLEFGDASGELRFTRKLDKPEIIKRPKRTWDDDRRRWVTVRKNYTDVLEEEVRHTETTDVAFVGDQIRLEFLLDNRFPQEQFEIVLGPGNRFQLENTSGAATAEAGGYHLLVKQDAENKRLYATDFFHLIPRRKDQQQSGATIEGKRISADLPAIIYAKWLDGNVRSNPSLTRIRLEGPPDSVSGTFIDAMRRAAACSGIEGEQDWERLSNQNATEISRVIITESFSLTSLFRSAINPLFGESKSMSIPIKLGDHAATLLLRDEFLRQMQSLRSDYATIAQHDKLVLAFLTMLDPYLLTERNPIYRMQVPDPDNPGQLTDFGHFLLTASDKLSTKPILPTRIALQKLIEAMDASIARASQARDCDLEELLTITGVSFGQVAEAVIPRLMRYRIDETTQRRVIETDKLGRSFVRNLADVALAVKALEAYSDADTQYSVSMAAAVLSAGMGALYSNGLIGLVTVTAMELPAIAMSIDESFEHYLENQKELEFARGATPVLGTNRLRDAEQNEVELFDVALTAYVEALGLVAGLSGDLGNALDAVKSATPAKLARLVKSGEGIAAEIVEQGARQLDLEEMTELAAFVKSARNNSELNGIGSLSELERTFLENIDKAAFAEDLTKTARVDTGDLANTVKVDTQDLIATRRPPANDNKTALLPDNSGVGNGRAASPEHAGSQVEISPLEPEQMQKRRLSLVGLEGGAVQDVEMGAFINRGSFNNIFEKSGTDRVYRASRVPVDHSDVQIDDMGWNAMDDVDHSIVRTPDVHGSFETEIDGNLHRVRELESFSNTAAAQIENNPAAFKGKMTPEQAIAFDSATREMNQKGYVWLDNHAHNYAFEPHPDGGGKLRVVVVDPGGIVKVKGENPAATARRIQGRINNPRAEFQAKMEGLDPEGLKARHIIIPDERRAILSEIGQHLDLPEGITNLEEQLIFRTDQNIPFKKIQNLHPLDGDQLQAAREALKAAQ